MSITTVVSTRSRVGAVVRVAVAVVAVVAVVCQLVQHTDPRFALVYFTVDSALLLALAVTWAASGWRPAAAQVARGAGVVGVLVSAVVFTTVIAPHTPTGTWFQPWDDGWVRTSTVLMHAVLPVLALLDDWLHPAPALQSRWRVVLSWLWWPVAYVLVVGGLSAAGMIRAPYVFLQPTAVGGWTVVAAIVAITAMGVGAGWLVVAARGWMRGRPSAS